MQFYAWTRNPAPTGHPFYRLRIDEAAQSKLDKTIREQASVLLKEDARRIPFDAGFDAKRGKHLFEVRNFPVPDYISDTISKPDTTPDFKQSLLERGELKAIVAIDFSDTSPTIYFQAFDRRYSLASKQWLFLDEKMFRLLNKEGITLSTNVDAVLDGATLLFVSPTMVRRVLDFSVVFEPATDQALSKFSHHELFDQTTHSDLSETADNVIRKKVSQLLYRGILDQIEVKDVEELATTFDVKVNSQRIDGEKKLILPEDRAELKDLLTLLEEKLYLSPLTARRMEASGNRYLDNDSKS